MNDRHDPYREFRGYDEYGRPVWDIPPDQGAWTGHGTGEPATGGPGGWDGYGGDPASAGNAARGYDQGHGGGQGEGYDADHGRTDDPGTVHGYGTAEWSGNTGADGWSAGSDGGWNSGGSGGWDGYGHDAGGWDAAGTAGDPGVSSRTAVHPEGPTVPGPRRPEDGGGYDAGGYGSGYADGAGGYDDRETDRGYGATTAGDGPDDLRDPAGTGAGTSDGNGDRSGTDDASGEPREYHTEQFAFVEEKEESSEDVIDWLEFSESRTERREEAKRRAVGRIRLLAIAVALVLLGGIGWLWVGDRLPFMGEGETEEEAAPGVENRDVIIVHLRETNGDTTSTALLVANRTTRQGTTLLLPNELVVTPDGGTTTLGQAVTEEGAASVREAVGTLLGADIRGTWRLDTPYLENLVDLVGGIAVDTDTAVTDEDGEEVVAEGEGTSLTGGQAVAYAVHRADDEPQSAQLERFGQVMSAVWSKMPDTEDAATRVVENLAQVPDPSLSENELGAHLARLAGTASSNAHAMVPLRVREDGTIDDETAENVVAAVLGGTVNEAEGVQLPRVAVRDGSEGGAAGESARVLLVNGGFTVVETRAAEEELPESEVRYRSESFRQTAIEVARTLGLPDEAAVEGDVPGNADIVALVGADLDPAAE
ncbi:LCP family protein [Streptomyces sp. ST2-7A]|uniref:LCP family protein n=1 Tax=Streptomyces sp. ST2-7A TaxID=2907214 RepID=UPI001F472CD7|nr:LCP family protein [Streptomyces sp. ST2-7A]MCE7079193.1 LCP family protein [Streptomyces sp. ST2-7A]